MAKSSSSLASKLGRAIKCVMVALLVPLAIGLLLGMLEQLAAVGIGRTTAGDWVRWGFMTYVWVHLLLWRPAKLFQASHTVFSVLAAWLFGGQVASTDKGEGGKGAKGGEAGSPLVAFSPYVVPIAPILVCALGWLLARWLDHTVLDAPVSFGIGLLAAFHWLMTADALQQQRARWHLETYLLAIGLVFILSLLIGGSAIMLALPEFSYGQAVAGGFAQAHALYAALIQRLFL